MITKQDEIIVEAIKKHIDQQAMVNETEVDWEKIQWVETLDRLVNNLRIAPVSFRFCSPDDVVERYFTAECDKCGWWGSSKLLDGGGVIADTGDYFGGTCPVCGNVNINEKNDESKTCTNTMLGAVASAKLDTEQKKK